MSWHIADVAELIASETETAARLCEDILTGPVPWWPQRLRKTHGTGTLGMVREILGRMPRVVQRHPEGALQITAMAMMVADSIAVDEYPEGMVLRARAQALRDHGYVLAFLQRFPEALDYVGRAERAFEDVPAADFDLARLWVVKATALRMQDREAEAAALARHAAEVFDILGDRARYVTAKIVEIAVLHDTARYEEAIAVCREIEADAASNPVLRISVSHNIAVCLCELGRGAEAVVPLQRSVAEFERLGLTTETTRARWYLGNALLATGRHHDAVALLRRAHREFTAAKMPVDAALAALDLAEALVALEAPLEVPAICRDVIAQLTAAGLVKHALPALALLREAAELGRASRAQIRDAHAVVRREARAGRVGG